MHRLILYFLTIWLGFESSSWASPTLDKVYRLKTVVPLVVNIKKEPVHGDHVERELIRLIDSGTRFHYSSEGYVRAKRALKRSGVSSFKKINSGRIQELIPMMRRLSKTEVDALILTEIQFSPERYNIAMMLVNLRTVEIIHQTTATVTEKMLLSGFSEATQIAFDELIKGIPFDASIIKRDGYRVILDYGGPLVSVGMQLPVYTVEMQKAHLILQESGTIVLTRVDDTLSFGRIVVESKPYEIYEHNKIRVPGLPKVASLLFTPPLSRTPRELASTFPVSGESPRPTFGLVDLSLGGSLVTFNSLAQDGTGPTSSSTFYPGGSLRGELWLTRSMFARLGFQFAMATLTPEGSQSVELNSNINNFKLQLGYQLPFQKNAWGPKVYLKTGFVRQQFSVDTQSALSFLTTTYTGVLIGAGLTLPIKQRYGLGFDLDALLTGKVSESPFQSGARTNSKSGWSFQFGGYYRYSPTIKVNLGFQFQSFRAEFEGIGTRPKPFISSSQTARSLLAGLSYYF